MKRPQLSFMGWVRFLWRQLTSMETALVLLVLLAIAAVPGSIFPQRSVNPNAVAAYLKEKGDWGKFLDQLYFFDVYASPWFSAVYLLLFVSLIGCVLPRLRTLWKQLRQPPPKTPSKLQRFTGYESFELDTDEELVKQQALKFLRRRHYRVREIDEATGMSISAEAGYSREAGNLLFHFSLVGVLVFVALEGFTQYGGQVALIEGESFNQQVADYDSFSAGPWADKTNRAPLDFTLEKFRASYHQEPGTQFGSPKSFEADLEVNEPSSAAGKKLVRVNQPLEVPGASVFLLGNGYAPEVEVKDRTGQVVAEGTIIAAPRDGNMTSSLVVKAPDAKPEALALIGIFMPTGEIDEQGPHSLFPDLVKPEIAFVIYTGEVASSSEETVFDVDMNKVKPVTGADGKPLLLRIGIGQSAQLPGGEIVTFKDVKRFAAFDIKHEPFLMPLLISAILSLVGLALSLFVPRRRLWMRIVPAAQAGFKVEVAGLTRADDPALIERVQEFAAEIKSLAELDNVK